MVSVGEVAFIDEKQRALYSVLSFGAELFFKCANIKK
jgi:hypothetical protein